MRLAWWRQRDHERTWGETASAWIDGELSPAETARFQSHADSCAACSARIAAFQHLGRDLTAAAGAVATPAAYRIFERVSNSHAHPLTPRVPSRLALAAGAVMLVGGGAAAPPVRAGIGNVVEYVQAVIAPGSSASLTGDRALFNAPHNSIVVGVAHQYGVFSANGNGSDAKPLLNQPVGRAPLFALSGGRILFQTAAGPDAGWRIAGPDGAVSLFPIPPGMDVLAVTPAGDRILLRMPDGHGGYSSAAGATQVVDSNGSVIWVDPGGSDVYSLSPDGKYALSGIPNDLIPIPLTGGALQQTPYTGLLISRPQTSADGKVQAFLTEPTGRAGPLTLRYALLGGAFDVPSFTQVSANVAPVFALSPDGRFLAAQVIESGTAAALNIWMLGPTSATPVSIPAFNGTTVERLTWSPDGRRLLVLDDRGGKGEAWLVDPPGGLTQVLPGTDVAAAAWRTDGSGVVAISDHGDAAGHVAVGGAAKAGHTTRLDASADTGPQPLFARRSGLAALIEPAGDVKLLARKGLPPLGVAGRVDAWSWSPDGRSAVVVRGTEIFLWSSRSGLSAQPFTSGTAAEWSPAGDRIFVLGADGRGALFDAHGRHLQDTPDDLTGVALRWAPDGHALAGVTHAAGGDRLMTWSPGTAAVGDVASGGRIGTFGWSPDGRSLAYLASQGDEAAATLYAVTASGAAPRPIGVAAGRTASLLWGADGTHVLYIDQAAPGTPGRLHSAAVDGSEDSLVGTLWAVNLAPAPR